MKILIIGQGIAGTLLSYTLRKLGADVHIVDTPKQGCSTRVAAGIINPVTGKRFVKTWLLDSLYPAAQKIYLALGQELGCGIWENRPILRLLGSPEEINDWSSRCALPDYADYLSEKKHAQEWQPVLNQGFHFGLIHQSARINFSVLLDAYKQQALEQSFFLNQWVNYDSVPELLKQYDKIVFCEGYKAIENPYFPNVPWYLAKGEALIFRFKDFPAFHPSEMLKKTSLVSPLNDGLFWAGGGYQWDFSDVSPSANERKYIETRLKEMFAVPYEIIDHLAGIRPTLRTRKPVLEESGICKNVFIFNGMGTKGALQTPYFAQNMAEQLLNKSWNWAG